MGAGRRVARASRGHRRRPRPHPEAIAFSIIAGVDPQVGLYASCIAVVIAFAGGRPAMISAASGAMALVMVTLVRENGLQYLLAATLLTGLIQIAAGLLRLGDLMRFVSRSVITGFVNALAILIFLAPKSSSVVMLVTVAVVVWTHDLAQSVMAGVLLSGIFFARKVAKVFFVDSSLDPAKATRTYVVSGQIFFATAEAFHDAFDFREEGLSRVVIDVSAAHFWDITAIGALDRVVLKRRHHGIAVEVKGMNAASATLVERLGTHQRPGASLARAEVH
jgi:SulP family sulfate permease